MASGALPQFSWIEPAFFDIPGLHNGSDQHPSHDVSEGERLIKSVYETLRQSALWNETLLLITWDEHGGFYDHVHPPVSGIPQPDGVPCRDCGGTSFNFTRLGVRIPLVAVSPWIAAGTVVHEPPSSQSSSLLPSHTADNSDIQVAIGTTVTTPYYELSSLLGTIRRVFNMTAPPLTARDAAAALLNDVWDGSSLQQPRTDCPLTLPDPPAYSPAHAGKPADAAERLPPSDLQRELLFLAEGLRTWDELTSLASSTSSGEGDSLHDGVLSLTSPAMDSAAVQRRVREARARLVAEGALASEAAAGRHALAFAQRYLGR